MKLTRALELCQQPLDATKSHMIKVNRFALIHTLSNRIDLINEIKQQRGEIDNLNNEVSSLSQFKETIMAGLDADALNKALEDGKAKLDERTAAA